MESIELVQEIGRRITAITEDARETAQGTSWPHLEAVLHHSNSAPMS